MSMIEEGYYYQDKGIINKNNGEPDLHQPHFIVMKKDERNDMLYIQEVTSRRVTMRMKFISEFKLFMKRIF